MTPNFTPASRRHARACVLLASAAFALSSACGPLYAQAVPATPDKTHQPAASTDTGAPSAEALSLAHTLIAKSNTGGLAAMNGLSLPLATLLHDMGVHPEQSRAVMTQAVMPVLLDHSDELTDIAANSYASVLSTETMKAAIAFYDTDAGKALVKAHVHITQLNMAGINQLFEKLKPEFEAKTKEVLKSHG